MRTKRRDIADHTRGVHAYAARVEAGGRIVERPLARDAALGASADSDSGEAARTCPFAGAFLTPGSYALLEVTSCGMDAKRAAPMRDPLLMPCEGGEATGFGFEFVDAVVHDFGGAIEVATGPALATTFTIWLRTAAPFPA